MTKFILPLILVLAAFFRLYNLSHLPISLFGDEVDVGYHAWSLITTGRDYMGNLLPSYIKSLSESRAPFLMYVTTPFVGLLGPSAFSVRLPTAMLGVLGVYLIFLLAKKLFPDKKYLGLLSAFILGLTPWHIHYSRAAFESVLLLDLIMLGAYLFLSEKITLALVFFSLTLYTYSTANIFSPLLLLGLYLLFSPKLNIKKDYLKFIPALIIVIPIAYQIIFGQAAGRFKNISIFSDQKLVDSVVIQRTDPWVKNQLADRVFTNKYEAIFREFLKNYTNAFNKDFLFVNGDPYFRHSVGRVGEFLWPILPLFLLGLAVLIRTLGRSEKLLLLWLFLAPFPSALTQGGSTHATRLFILIPPICLISALGANMVIKVMKKLKLKNIAFALYGLIVLYSFAVYWNRYSAHYAYESAKFWHYGFEDIFTKLQTHLPVKGKLYINNSYEPSLIRFAFFTKLPPTQFQKMFVTDNPGSYKSDLFNGFRFGENIYFGQARDLASLIKLLSPGDIYMAVQGKDVPGDWDWSATPPEGLRVLEETNDIFGKPLFYLVTKRDI